MGERHKTRDISIDITTSTWMVFKSEGCVGVWPSGGLHLRPSVLQHEEVSGRGETGNRLRVSSNTGEKPGEVASQKLRGLSRRK